MTDQHSAATGPQPAETKPRRGRGRTAILIVLVALAGGIVGSLGTKAFGQGAGYGPPMGFFGGPIDPVQADRMVERMIKHLAVEADATADQQTKLVAIAKGAVRDLLPLRDKSKANRARAVDLFVAPNVDRAAIEQLRAEQIGLAETASKRIAQALADAADVLNADQRKTLVERVSHFHGPMGRWHRG